MKSGLLLLNKQPGLTSFDCIRELKRAWKRTDLGHGGTLDKFATGVLPVLAGEGLKLARFFLENHPTLPTYWKTYSGTFEFGTKTETADPEGAVLETRDVAGLSVGDVQRAMDSFVGVSYEQLPPRYSAKKIGGQRASDLARAGEEPELKAVSVTIKRFRCLGVDDKFVRFEVECSKGTYVRRLAEDLAEKLGTVAYVKTLVREAVGGFSLAQALTLEDVLSSGMDQALLDMRIATSFLQRFELLPIDLDHLAVGKTDGVLTRLANSGFAPTTYCAVSSDGTPRALLELGADRRATYLRGLNSAE